VTKVSALTSRLSKNFVVGGDENVNSFPTSGVAGVSGSLELKNKQINSLKSSLH
jgi:hypothetical protein